MIFVAQHVDVEDPLAYRDDGTLLSRSMPNHRRATSLVIVAFLRTTRRAAVTRGQMLDRLKGETGESGNGADGQSSIGCRTQGASQASSITARSCSPAIRSI